MGLEHFLDMTDSHSYNCLIVIKTCKCCRQYGSQPDISIEKNNQEAHEPHCSPEKTVQINKHIRLYHHVENRR